MERILIIGCSGSGKSTLARALGARLDIPVVHLDRLWWRSGWENVTREEFDQALARELARDRWVMDGNYSRTIPQRLSRCDTIIYLDFGRWACLRGVAGRMVRYRGRVRPDMSPGCPERLDPSFLRWVWDFNKNNRVQNYTWLAQARHAQTVVLKNRREVEAFLRELEVTPRTGAE